MSKKTAAEIVVEQLERGIERRRQLALHAFRHGSPVEHLRGIVDLWLDRHGYKRPQG